MKESKSRKYRGPVDFLIFTESAANPVDEAIIVIAERVTKARGGEVSVDRSGDVEQANKLSGRNVRLPRAFWGDPPKEKGRPWTKQRNGSIEALRTAFPEFADEPPKKRPQRTKKTGDGMAYKKPEAEAAKAQERKPVRGLVTRLRMAEEIIAKQNGNLRHQERLLREWADRVQKLEGNANVHAQALDKLAERVNQILDLLR